MNKSCVLLFLFGMSVDSVLCMEKKPAHLLPVVQYNTLNNAIKQYVNTTYNQDAQRKSKSEKRKILNQLKGVYYKAEPVVSKLGDQLNLPYVKPNDLQSLTNWFIALRSVFANCAIKNQ